MDDKEKRPTSGFVAGFGGECGFSGAQQDSGFSNISEVYVSKSGFSRLLSAVKYGKRYMLKCLKPDFAFTPVYRQALMKEFEIGLQLDHPNICRTISMEPVEELGECIVMEYVDGENLETAVTSGTFTEEKARKIAAQLLDAMEYMHAKQTVHRDIKPSNIMVENGNNVRLMDLGISRVNGGNKFSQYGFIGTPQYSSPEQIKRDESSGAESINGRSDIYELGITLYELITGSNPMDKGNDTETLAAQISEKLPPSDKIPPQLMRVIWKATEKDQMKRFQTVKEFKQAITMALTYQPTTMEKTMEWAKRNKALAAIMVFLAICAMAMVIVLPFIINQQ